MAAANGFHQHQLQMSWQKLLKKRKSGPPLGFRNLGNTCYLNSVLQCLTYTPPLANFCLQSQHSDFCESVAQQDKKSDCPFCLLEKRIARSLSIDSTLDTPTKIIGGLKIFAENFCFGRQEDAHEFLRYVIDACHTTCLRLKKLQQQRRKFVSNGGGHGFGSSTVVKEIFGGALQSQVKCLSCGHESNKVDEIMDISIDVLNSSSLKEAFQKFFQSEVLDGNNKYKCDSCKKLVRAKKQMSILQAPNILVVQLKRFEGIFGGKIDKIVTFEEVLVLSNFMSKTSQDPHPEYKLFATIVHSGFSPDSGHYYAYIKDTIGRWYCCNDSYVSISTLQEVFSEKVYILFFSRTKQRPALPNKSLDTNGTKPHDCNGNHASKAPKSDTIVKSSDSESPKADSATTLEVSKVLIGPRRKPVSFGNFGVKKFPKIIVKNKENNDGNGDSKASQSKKTSDTKIPLVEDKNGSSQNKSVANGNAESQRIGDEFVANGCKTNGIRNGKESIPLVEDKNGFCQNTPVANGNAEIERNGDEFVANGCKSNGVRNGPLTGKMPNGISQNLPDRSDSKGKHDKQNSCDLVAEDHQLEAKRNELKELLGKEASSFLHECGFMEKVESSMRDMKRSARDEGNDTLQRNELKRKMIADAKATFISQIPEVLKADLVKRIRAHIDL
uniref:ubiquitin carboxyl-terminal hydrolase 25 n=1 Tax=Erigeron canadensis TaxID=72917 RepID=UPI001CB9D7D2|nr:ubiquitin carboxyl-terminal hydrolase 25 [Erigeron canadensis]XP_043622640.1 ubiquitin carboxyl-terminal hydrolase 25 [Erigeron canadensis]